MHIESHTHTHTRAYIDTDTLCEIQIQAGELAKHAIYMCLFDACVVSIAASVCKMHLIIYKCIFSRCVKIRKVIK